MSSPGRPKRAGAGKPADKLSPGGLGRGGGRARGVSEGDAGKLAHRAESLERRMGFLEGRVATLEEKVVKLEEEVRQTRRVSEGYRDRMEKLEEAVRQTKEERGGQEKMVMLEQMEGELRERMKEEECRMNEERKEEMRRVEEKLEGELRGLREMVEGWKERRVELGYRRSEVTVVKEVGGGAGSGEVAGLMGRHGNFAGDKVGPLEYVILTDSNGQDMGPDNIRAHIPKDPRG